MPRMYGRLILRAGFAVFLALSLLACAAQTVIYEKASPFSRIIVTEDPGGMRTLLFDTRAVRQSVVKPGDPDHLELPYARVALVALAMTENPRRILVVGLGGGTLPMILHRHYPEAAIDVAEIDPDVVDVAKKFFGFLEDGRMRAHVGDGRKFIENVRQRAYDVIFLDAFGSEKVPAHLTTREFLQAVRRAVTPGGVVVGNVWRRAHNPLYDSMVRTYQEVFDELLILDVFGDVNNVLFALPRKRTFSRGELAALARKVAAEKRFRYDLGDLVERGFIELTGKDPRGRVLRDADLERQGGR